MKNQEKNEYKDYEHMLKELLKVDDKIKNYLDVDKITP
jgi:hypothetical protein